MNQNNKIVRNYHLIARKLKSEFIVLDANKGNLYKLNPTAQHIWKFTAKQKSVREIIDEVSKEFSVDENRAKKEVEKFIEQYLNILFFAAKK